MGEFKLLRCANCSLAWVSPIPTAQELHAYYSEVYSPPHHSPSRTRVIVSELRARITQLNPRARSILDFGGGDGAIAAELLSSGFEVTLVEPAETERSKATARGLKTAPTVRDLGEAEFDIVLMRHVLEHLPEPAAVVRTLSERLRSPGGVLGVGVPNFDCLLRKLVGPGWEWFSPPAHLFYFNRRSLTALLEGAGLFPIHHYLQRGDAVPLPLGLLAAPLRILLRLRKSNGWWKPARQSRAPAATKGSRAASSLYRVLHDKLSAVWPWGDEELWIWATRT